MNIGTAIKKLRQRHNISQLNLVKKLGISQGYLSLIEKGDREPSFELVKHIAEALDIPQQLILIIACANSTHNKKYARQLKKITLAIDDILNVI